MKRDLFHLDAVAGWRADSMQGLVMTPNEGALQLPPLAGAAKRVSLGGHPAIACVKALANGECGELFLLDAGKNLVRRRKRFDEVGCTRTTLEVIPAIGDGRGHPSGAPRMLREPRGLTVGRGGELAVADTGNGRIQIFEPVTWALIQVWEGFKRPWNIVWHARKQVYYVSEPAADRLVVVDSAGSRIGSADGAIFSGVRQIAICPMSGDIAAITRIGVVIEEADGAPGWRVLGEEKFTALCFDRLGRLHVAGRDGVVHQFARMSGVGRQKAGVSFCGVSGRVDAMAEWPASQGLEAPSLLLAILREDDRRTTLWTVKTDGASAETGWFQSQTLDSGIDNCQWHRVVLEGEVPAGAQIVLRAETARTEIPKPDWQGSADFHVPGPVKNIDYLVQAPPGRFLRFRIELKSGGESSPSIRSVRAQFPRRSYLRYLPSVYQDDPESRRFLDRFLSLFQTLIEEEHLVIEEIHRMFDPLTTPEKFLPWLAEWLAFPLQPTWPLERKRQLLAEAFTYYQIRGTKLGLEWAVRNLAQTQHAAVLEHFRLRRIPELGCVSGEEDGTPLWSPKIYSRWQLGTYSTVGEFRLLEEPEPAVEPFARDAHRFSVFFPADPANPEGVAMRVARTVAAEKPAHTEATLCAVFPRMRVGVQARVGVDAMIGEVSFMILSGTGKRRMSRLGYDTILNPSEPRQALQARGLDTPPAVGGNTRLL
ncbi:MAG: phage tail protein [Acidobacteriota bacterium]